MADVVRKQIVAVIDGRTSMVCLRAAGQVRDIGEPFDTLLGPQMAPPFHRHCRSVVGMYVPGMGTRARSDAETEIESRPPSRRRDDRVPPLADVDATPLPGTTPDPSRKPKPPAAGWERPWTAQPVPDVVKWQRAGKPLADAPAAVRDAADDLYRATATARPLKRDTRIYRALAVPARVKGDRSAAGLVFRDPAFGAASRDRAVAEGLAHASDVVLIVTAPKGSRLATVPGRPGEVIVPAGARYRVTSDRYENVGGRSVRVWRATIE